MSKISNRILLATVISLFASTILVAQVRPPLPRPSQKSTVTQTVGTTDISIVYSRPEKLTLSPWVR
jgi:hypothetical protein